jgi:hypothetical protein
MSAIPGPLTARKGTLKGAAPMQTPAVRAFSILQKYCSNRNVLGFGGKFLGERAACEALISYVWPEQEAIGIKLLSHDRKHSWDRLIPLKQATFSLSHLGDVSFEQFANRLSVLIMKFPDGTEMYFAEPDSDPRRRIL